MANKKLSTKDLDGRRKNEEALLKIVNKKPINFNSDKPIWTIPLIQKTLKQVSKIEMSQKQIKNALAKHSIKLREQKIVPDEVFNEMIDMVNNQHPKEKGYEKKKWSVETLCQWLSQEKGIKCAAITVRSLLKSHGYKPASMFVEKKAA